MAGAFLQRFDLKVVLLGSSKSGKTALLHRYITHDYRDALPSTYDTAFAAKKVEFMDGTSVALAIWDTAGSPKFAHLSRMFIRGADAVLLCYDVTSRDHWERLKIWAHEAQTRQRGCRIYLVCTKLDLLQPPAWQGQRAQHAQQRQQCSDSSSLGEASRSSSAAGSEGEGSPAGLGSGLQAVAGSEEWGSPGALSGAGGSQLDSRAARSPDRQGRGPEATGTAQASGELAQQGHQVHGGTSHDAAGKHSLHLGDTDYASQGSPAGSQPPSSTAGSSALPPLPPRCCSTSPAELAHSGGHAGPAGRSAGPSGPRTVSWDISEDEWERAMKASSRRQSQQHIEEPTHQKKEQQQPQHQQQQEVQHREQQEWRGPDWGRAGGPVQAQQAVPDAEVRAFCDSVGAKLFRTSSRTGEGVVAMFHSIAKECCARNPAPVQPRSAAASPQKGHQQPTGQGPQHGSASGGDSTPCPPTPATVARPASRRHSTESSGGGLAEGGGGGEAVGQEREQERPRRPPPGDQQPLAGNRRRSSSGSRRHSSEGWPPQYPVQHQERHGPQEYVIDASSFEAAPALVGHDSRAAPGPPRQPGYSQYCAGQEGGPGPMRDVPSLDYNAKGTCKIS
ncbi:hypothetical protein N2152v2_001744 [Parachlorella kessleri]